MIRTGLIRVIFFLFMGGIGMIFTALFLLTLSLIVVTFAFVFIGSALIYFLLFIKRCETLFSKRVKVIKGFKIKKCNNSSFFSKKM